MGGWIGVFLIALVAYSLSGWGADWVMVGLIAMSVVMMLSKHRRV
jgi:hypothetical protein